MLLARKKGMTQVFADDGQVVPVTLLDYSECRVIKGLKKSGNFLAIGRKRHPKKPEIGVYGPENVPEYSVKVHGDDIDIGIIEVGDVVHVTGKSKGKGFAGVVKMWGFKGGKRTRGQSDRERHPGSIGAGTTTGRVFKGLKMGRRKGCDTITVKNLEVVGVDTESKIIAVKGSVPGTYDSIVKIIKVKSNDC